VRPALQQLAASRGGQRAGSRYPRLHAGAETAAAGVCMVGAPALRGAAPPRTIGGCIQRCSQQRQCTLMRCGGNQPVPTTMRFLCCGLSAALRSEVAVMAGRCVRCCCVLRCEGSLRPHLDALRPGTSLSPRLEHSASERRAQQRCMCALGPLQCSWSARRGPSRSTPGPSATAASSRRGAPAGPGPVRPQLARPSGPARRAALADADSDPSHPVALSLGRLGT